MTVHYKSLEPLIERLESGGLEQQILSNIPDTILYNSMKGFGFSDAEIIHVLRNLFGGVYKRNKCSELYDEAIKKMSVLKEFNLLRDEVNLNWLTKDYGYRRVETIILRTIDKKQTYRHITFQ